MISEKEIEALAELLKEDRRSEIPIARSFLEDLVDRNFEPKQVVKTEFHSQACPICKRPVNQRYCGHCGQLLKY